MRFHPRRALRAASTLVLLAVASTALAQDASPVTTVVVLVRHAEKAAAPANDPVLSPAGELRAQALADALDAARIDGVITTPLQRTRQTAAPIVRARGLTPIEVPASGDVAAHAAAVATAVREKFVGRTVLVVGHSNTVPAIIRALGGPVLPALCDSDYANMFVIVHTEGQQARLIRATYGAADLPRDEACAAAMRRE